MDRATVFERTCSFAHSAIIKSNCRMEITYPLASASPSSARLSNACTTTGKAVRKVYNESALLTPIVSHARRSISTRTDRILRQTLLKRQQSLCRVMKRKSYLLWVPSMFLTKGSLQACPIDKFKE